MKTSLLYVLLGAMSLMGGIGMGYIISQGEEPIPTQNPHVEAEKAPEKPSVEELFRLTNLEREKAGVKPLVLDERLNRSAQRKAEQLEREGWSNDPHGEKSGKRGYTYAEDAVDECVYAGENLTHNIYDNTSKSAIDAWMKSRSHREALLDKKHEYVGFGIQDRYIVQHFCDID